MQNGIKWLSRMIIVGVLVYYNFSMYKSYKSALELFYDYADVKSLLADEDCFDNYSVSVKGRVQEHFDTTTINYDLVEHIFISFIIVSGIAIILIIFISVGDIIKSVKK